MFADNADFYLFYAVFKDIVYHTIAVVLLVGRNLDDPADRSLTGRHHISETFFGVALNNNQNNKITHYDHFWKNTPVTAALEH